MRAPFASPAPFPAADRTATRGRYRAFGLLGELPLAQTRSVMQLQSATHGQGQALRDTIEPVADRGRRRPWVTSSSSSWTIARALADAGVNILGHLFLGRWGDRAMFAFVVDDPVIARPILERKA